MTNAREQSREVQLDEIVLYVHLVRDGDSWSEFPWVFLITRSSDLQRLSNGKAHLSHPDVLKWGNTTTRFGALFSARRWCRKNAKRLAGRESDDQYQRYIYNASWEIDE